MVLKDSAKRDTLSVGRTLSRIPSYQFRRKREVVKIEDIHRLLTR